IRPGNATPSRSTTRLVLGEDALALAGELDVLDRAAAADDDQAAGLQRDRGLPGDRRPAGAGRQTSAGHHRVALPVRRCPVVVLAAFGDPEAIDLDASDRPGSHHAAASLGYRSIIRWNRSCADWWRRSMVGRSAALT